MSGGKNVMARGRSRASSDRAKEGEGSPRRGSQSTLYIKNCGELLEYFEEGNVFMRHLIFKRPP